MAMAPLLFQPRALYLCLILGGVLMPLPSASAASSNTAAVSLAVQPVLMLARDWQSNLNPAHYLVSEKFDGVRAYWDGHALRFKSGRPIAAPAWFVAGFPVTPLDGELWLGRRSFDRLSGVVRKNEPVDAEWREVRYLVFDTPGAAGSFAERAAHIEELVKRSSLAWLQTVKQVHVADQKALRQMLQATAKVGGEGLVLHRADALWQPGRNDALRKLKMQPDEEARVVGYIPGKGRYSGNMGALLLETANGKRFALGTGFTDAQRADPPAVGALVMYQYRGRTSTGLPRFTSFLREREAE
jgi:DNA ligase-1